MFSWIPFFKEIAQHLPQYEQKQEELIAVLKECGITMPQDESPEGVKVALTELDPFTFFASFLKYGILKRREYFGKLKTIWALKSELDADENFEGVPTANTQSFWYFRYKFDRKEQDIPTLWRLFKQVQKRKIEHQTWKYATTDVKTVRLAKITQGLFWLDADRYFPVDSQTVPFLKRQGLPYEVKDLTSYYNLLEAVKKHFKKPFYEISHEAWAANQTSVHEAGATYRVGEIATSYQAATPLNTILFGPPGTGKTYHTVNYALSIIEGKSLDVLAAEPRSELKRRFDAHAQSGQVAFVTFHPSFSYEDFVEGIKPKMVNEDSGSDAQNLQYEVRKGIFRLVSERAASYQAFAASDDFVFPAEVAKQLEKINFGKLTLGSGQSEEDKAVYQFCLENNRIALGWGNDHDCSAYQNEADLRQALHALGETNPTVNEYLKRFIFDFKANDLIFIPDGNNRIRAIGQVSGDYFYEKNDRIPYRHFRPVQWLVRDANIPIEEVYPRKFSPQTLYVMYHDLVNQDFFRKSPPDKSLKNHVLVIDEINRGNVANIFGELMTLLEADKRIGNSEALTITLPYSKETFGVPSNLYLVGTMNTADRSIEALDTALRRRFMFQEMRPNASLIAPPEALKVDVVKMFHTINQRIEALLDKDHILGHAYFMEIKNLDELRKAFSHHILPLLQEYFYHDAAKIGMILGDSFVRKLNPLNHEGFAKGFTSDYFEENARYEFTNPMHLDESAFEDIYK